MNKPEQRRKYDVGILNILGVNDYKIVSGAKSNLTDIVMCFFNGIDIVVIPINVALSYPTIRCNIYDDSDSGFVAGSILTCPMSMVCCGFKSIANLIGNDKNKPISVVRCGDQTFPLIESWKFDCKRFQLSVKTLRNAFSDYPDVKYLVVNKSVKHMGCIFSEDYYKNDVILYDYEVVSKQFHPKTLVWLIQYFSHIDGKCKTTVLVGKDGNNTSSSGYDIKKSGILDYLDNNDDKLVQKMAFITPVLWFSWKYYYSHDVKIIYIN